MTQTGDISTQIDETASAVEGNLTTLPLSTAIGIVSKWKGTLHGTGDPALQSIANDLGQLESQLSGGNISANAVSGLLLQLGEKVSTLASGQSGAVASGLTRLSSALSTAGTNLAP